MNDWNREDDALAAAPDILVLRRGMREDVKVDERDRMSPFTTDPSHARCTRSFPRETLYLN